MTGIDRQMWKKSQKLGMTPEQWVHYRNRALKHISAAEQFITRLETQPENPVTYSFICDAISRHLHAGRVLTMATETPNRLRLAELGRRFATLNDQPRLPGT
jgi:hypothetical protein